MKTDLIIIGAGPAGYRAAEYAAKNGLDVIVFEEQQIGGTCLNVGCIPTKTLVKNAEVFNLMNEAEKFGFSNLEFSFDYNRVLQRKEDVVSALRNGVESILNNPKITLVKAKAQLISSYSVLADNVVYEADNIIIATGAENKTLHLENMKRDDILDSTKLLSLESLPKSLCIIGAGVIGMEFASIFNAFGVEVYVVEFLKECLPALDSDIAKRLRKTLEKKGVKFYMQSTVKSIEPELVVFENKKGKLENVSAEKVLVAVGRKPRTDGLALNSINVKLERGTIPVDRTDFNVIDNRGNIIKSVFAVGDVNGLQMLAHAAEMQAIHVVNHIIGKQDEINLQVMPAAIFTLPEAACVGMSEDQCKDNNIDYYCKKAFWRANGKALAMDETDGMLKLIINSQHQIIGCHAFGAHAADLVQEISVLMCKHTTLQQLEDMVHIHPSLSEIIRSAAEA